MVDSSVLYAALHAEDVHHERARDDIADPEPILAPVSVLTETVDLVADRFGPAHGPRALAALLDLPHLAVAEPVRVKAVAQVHAASEGRLSLVDPFVVQTCRALGMRPLSYDDALVEAVGEP